jgi:glycosyltransferase involved in cell wall biosynthesis
MKIAIVHSFYSSRTPSGENQVVLDQVKLLEDFGHDVRLFRVDTDEEIVTWRDKLRTGIQVMTGFGYSPEKEIRKFAPDLVHIHNIFPNISSRWLSDFDVPVVVTLHNFRSICPNGSLFLKGSFCDLCPKQGLHHSVINGCYRGSRLMTLPLYSSNQMGVLHNILLNSAEKIIVLNDKSLNLYQSYLPETVTKKMQVLPNFIPRPKQNFRQQVNKNYWLYAGRISEDKGILDLARAWDNQDKLVVFGSGPMERDLEIICQNRNVEFRGLVSSEEVNAALAISKGLVLPSKLMEQCPTVFLEAISLGKPVIAFANNFAGMEIQEYGGGKSVSNISEMSKESELSGEEQIRFENEALFLYELKYSPEVWLRNINQIYEETTNND